MSAEETQADGDSSGARDESVLLEPMRAALSQAPEIERYRLLADLFTRLADDGPGSALHERGRLVAAEPKNHCSCGI